MKKMSANAQLRRLKNAGWLDLWRRLRLIKKMTTKIKKKGLKKSCEGDGKRKMKHMALSMTKRRELTKKRVRMNLNG